MKPKDCSLLVKLSVVCLFALAVFVSSVQAQNEGEKPSGKSQMSRHPSNLTVKGIPIKVHVNPQTIQVKRLKPLAFKPYTFADFRNPQTGAVINEGSDVRLKNGKVIKGREFLAEANRLEQQFNTMGYTLRGSKAVVIQENIVNQQLLEQQRNKTLHFSPKITGKQIVPPDWNRLQVLHNEKQKFAASKTKLVHPTEQSKNLPKDFHPFHYEKHYDDTKGVISKSTLGSLKSIFN